MISLGVIGSTIFFLPGILYFVLRTKDTTPALQSRELDSSASLVAIGLIAFVSLFSHFIAIGILWVCGYVGQGFGLPVISWDFRLFDPSRKDSATFVQVIQILAYSIFACIIPCIISSFEAKQKIKLDGSNLTLSTLCQVQADDKNLLLVAYVYYKSRRGNDNYPISGLVGGVSLARLDAKRNVVSIVLIEPIPFVQFIGEDSLEADILEYSEHKKYGLQSNVSTEAEFFRQTIVEINSSEVSHVVYALHDMNNSSETETCDETDKVVAEA